MDNTVHNSLSKTIKDLSINRKKNIHTIDGIFRDEESENDLNNLFYSVFHDANGQKLLNYLRQITLNRPLGPNVSDAELRHMEGMRFLFGIIHKRYEKGKEK